MVTTVQTLAAATVSAAATAAAAQPAAASLDAQVQAILDKIAQVFKAFLDKIVESSKSLKDQPQMMHQEPKLSPDQQAEFKKLKQATFDTYLTNPLYKPMMLAHVKTAGMDLEFASKALRDDEEFVAAANSNDNGALQFASDDLKKKKDFVLTLVQKSAGSALRHVDSKLRDDADFVEAAIKITKYAFPHVGPQHQAAMQNERVFVKKLLDINPSVFQYAGKQFLDDEELFLQAVKSQDWMFTYASERLKTKMKTDIAFFKTIAAINPDAYEYILIDSYQDNEEIVFAAVKHDVANYRKASDRIKLMPEFQRLVSEASVGDSSAWSFADLEHDLKAIHARLKQENSVKDTPAAATAVAASAASTAAPATAAAAASPALVRGPLNAIPE